MGCDTILRLKGHITVEQKERSKNNDNIKE